MSKKTGRGEGETPHLAAQGIIKGHTGSGSRSTVHDEFLLLSDPRDDEVHFCTVGMLGLRRRQTVVLIGNSPSTPKIRISFSSITRQ